MDHVAEDKAFGIDGLHGDEDVGGEDVKDDARGNRVDVGKGGGDGGMECNFFMRGSVSSTGNTGKEMAGVEELEPMGNRKACHGSSGSSNRNGGELDHSGQR